MAVRSGPILDIGHRPAGADLSRSQYRVVKWDSDGEAVLVEHGWDPPAGILQNKAAPSGEADRAAVVQSDGVGLVQVSAAVTAGDVLVQGSDGRCGPATAIRSGWKIGTALSAAAGVAGNDQVSVDIDIVPLCVIQHSFIAGADLSATSLFKLVKIDNESHSVVPCSAVADYPVGVLLNQPADNAPALVAAGGVVPVRAGEAIAVGNPVGPDGNGDGVVQSTNGRFVFGVAITAAGAAGNTFYVDATGGYRF